MPVVDGTIGRAASRPMLSALPRGRNGTASFQA